MQRRGLFVLVGLGLCLLIAGVLSPFASPAPDAYEASLEKLGVEVAPATTATPLPDYEVPGMKNKKLSTGLAGLIGVGVTFALAYGLGQVASRRRRSGASEKP